MINDKLPYLRSTFDAELARVDAQAIVAMSPENFLHTTGAYVVSQRMIRERLALSIFVRGAAPFAVVSTVVVRTVMRDSWVEDVIAWQEHEETPIEKLVAELKSRGLASGKIALEKGYLAATFYDELRAALPGVEWVDADLILDRSRMVKTPDEIALMQRNGIAAEQAIWASFLYARTGTTERQLAQRMVTSLIELGADSSPFMSLAAGSEHGREHHAVPGAYEIERGDTVAVDMVGTFKGYYSDYARMAVVGEPAEGQRQAWAKVVEIQRRLFDDIVPGVTAEEIFRCAAAYARDLGTELDTNLVGHSLGIALHEYPVLTEGCKEVLRAGMTLCVEILIMDPEYGRFHIEDLVEVRGDGPARRLTTYFDTNELYEIQL
jgi:Xaa-Pro aminopeptidase